MRITQCLVVVSLLCVLVCGANSAHAKSWTNLTFSAGAANHPITTDVIEPFMKRAAQEFPGQLAFTYHAANTLFKENEAFDALNDGRADFARVRAGTFPGKINLIGVVDLPGMAPNAIVGSLVAQELMEKFPEVAAEFPKNAVPFTAWASASYQIHSIKPIKTPADIKGRKILVWDEPTGQIVTAIGGIPVSVVSTESAKALREGLGEAVLCPLAPIRAYKITDVAKYHAMLDLGVTSFNILVHKPLWESFPPKIQNWLKSQGGKTMALAVGECLERVEARDINILKQEGHQFFVFSPADRAVALKPLGVFKDRWLEDCVKHGINRDVAQKVAAFAEERVKYHTERLASAKK